MDPMKRNRKKKLYFIWNSRGRGESGPEYGQGGGGFSSNLLESLSISTKLMIILYRTIVRVAKNFMS
jgi:hypothetical protein